MNVQQHERIARIKQFSRYLYLGLTGMRYLLWVMWPLMAIFILVSNQGTFTFFDGAPFAAADVSLLPRIGMTVFLSVFLFLALQLISHFRELIRHFSNGDIFNKKAIDHARKALWNGLLIYGFYVTSLIVNWFYITTKSSPVDIPVNLDFIAALMFFGLMYVLLWALEIGCDLNEESELTI
jgi:hypothetical protein